MIICPFLKGKTVLDAVETYIVDLLRAMEDGTRWLCFLLRSIIRFFESFFKTV